MSFMPSILKNTLLCLFSILLFVRSVKSQDLKIDKVEKLNAITFSPLNLIDPVNPSFQMGYQRGINDKWEIQFEGAILMKRSPLDWLAVEEFENVDSLEVLHKGFRLRLELKYFLYQNQVDQHYVSVELSYLKNDTKTTYKFLSEDRKYYNDFFTNQKDKYGGNIKYGVKFLMGKRFFFETHAGIGVSFREIRHTDRENINDKLDALEWWDDNKIVGNKWVLNFPINGKVGYRF
jgi:hypothetical protein